MSSPIFSEVPPGQTRDCTDPWNLTYVRADGSVRLCCWSREVGNLHEQSMDEIVQGEKARKMRGGLLTGDLDEDCVRCPARGVLTIAKLTHKVEEVLNGSTTDASAAESASRAARGPRLLHRLHRAALHPGAFVARAIQQARWAVFNKDGRRLILPLAPGSIVAENFARAGPLPARGSFEDVVLDGRALHVSGWMFVPEWSVDSIRVELDGEFLASATVLRREDVARAYPHVGSALQSGFKATLAVDPSHLRDWSVIRVVGLAKDSPVAAMECAWRPDCATLMPDLPVPLLERVAQVSNARVFRFDGLRTLTDMMRALERHRAAGSIQRVLDFGCARSGLCGFLPARLAGAQIHGCDADGEVIAWLRDHVHGVEFRAIESAPTTPYAAGSFDTILASSVLAQLGAEEQLAWLAECRRLLAPGGLLVATLHGDFAAQITGDDALRQRCAGQGICDRSVDDPLPPGAYRATYQIEPYTRRAFGRELAVVEYLERGAGGFEDLVVLRNELVQRLVSR